MPQVQILPPSTVYRYQQPHYDEHQFSGPKKLHTSDTRLAYSDVQNGMHTVRRKAQYERRIETPTWALSDTQLLKVLVCFLEDRASIRRDSDDPVFQLALKGRLAQAEKKLAARAKRLQEHLRHWQHEYVELLKADNYRDPKTGHFSDKQERLKQLEREIKGHDTQLVLLTRPGGVGGTILRVVYLYFRLGWDSIAVAKEVKLCPPHIHQILFQMNRKSAQYLAEESPTSAV